VGSVVTVAELMRRCAPAPEVDDDGAAPIPVSALLRREGRNAAGLPVVHAPAVGDILSTLPARQPLLRRGAIAAGALLAAGSVFGLTAAMNAPVAPPTSSGTFPDQGEPSGPGSSGVLDAGQAATSTWLPVAFPTLFPEANAPAPQAAAPRAVAQPVAAQAPAANGGGTARQTSSAGSPATSAPRSTPAKKKDGSSVVGGTVDAVGGTVREVGENTPLKDVTDGVGNTVSGVGRQVGAITDPITDPITAPLTTTVKRVAAPLATPVTTLLTPPSSAAPTSSSAPSSSAKPSTSSAPTGIVKDLLG
jgi:LPS-assembly protein